MAGYTFDTNIIKGYKVERLPENFYMSSVVLSELMTSAVDQSEFDAYQETWSRQAKDGTLIVPNPSDWLMASKVLYWLAQERRRKAKGKALRWSPTAKQELAMDALIATSARRQGVTVVTNDTDFDAIKYYCKTLKLERGSAFFSR
jgi:predicted nucleic acid-binding protein